MIEPYDGRFSGASASRSSASPVARSANQVLDGEPIVRGDNG